MGEMMVRTINMTRLAEVYGEDADTTFTPEEMSTDNFGQMPSDRVHHIGVSPNLRVARRVCYLTNGLQPFFEFSGSVKPIASISCILPSKIL